MVVDNSIRFLTIFELLPGLTDFWQENHIVYHGQKHQVVGYAGEEPRCGKRLPELSEEACPNEKDKHGYGHDNN